MKCTDKMREAGLPASYWNVIVESLPNFNVRAHKALCLRDPIEPLTVCENLILEDLYIELYREADKAKLEAIQSPPVINHPLVNPESSHYNTVDGREAIDDLESIFSTEELKSWALITSYKYRLRIGDKDDVEKEVRKIKTYEAYYKYLDELE